VLFPHETAEMWVSSGRQPLVDTCILTTVSPPRFPRQTQTTKPTSETLITDQRERDALLGGGEKRDRYQASLRKKEEKVKNVGAEMFSRDRM